MKCPWCQGELQIAQCASYNVENYGETALVRANCCRNPINLSRVISLRATQSFTSSKEDNWGNEFGCEWLDDGYNYHKYESRVFKGQGKIIPENADVLTSDGKWYKIVGIFIMVLKDCWEPTGFKDLDDLKQLQNVVWVRGE